MKPLSILKLAIIVMSIFATNCVLQAQYIPCEQECKPYAGWEMETLVFTLPQWPDCEIYYTYQERICNGTHEMKGGQIKIYDSLCIDLLRWALDFKISQEQQRDRIEEIFTYAHQKVCDDYFMAIYNAATTNEQKKFHCDPSQEPFQGTTTTYIRAKCASLCFARWWEDYGYVAQFTLDDCDIGEGCCKLIRSYCWDPQKNEMQVTETTETTETSIADCDTVQFYPEQGCYPYEGEPSSSGRYPCKPMCKD